MKIGRIIALLTVIALSLGALTSCGGVEKKLDKAEDHFRSNPYQVKITVDFDTAAEDVAGIFSELEKTETTVIFDGASFTATNVTSIKAGDFDYKFNTTYTVIGETAYREISCESDGIPLLPKRSYTFLDATQRQTLAYKVARVGGVTTDGFANLTDTKIDSKTVSIECTEASDEVKESMRQMMVTFFEGTLERAVAKSVTLTLTLKDGHYHTATVVCDYDVTIGGTVYSVSARVNLELDFGYQYKVTAPAEPIRYSIIDPEEMLPL